MNKILKTLGLLSLSLFLGFFVGVGIKYKYASSVFKPFEWNSPPVVINCYGDDFSKLQMERAIQYWDIIGYKIAFYEHSPPKSVCENKWLEGMIILRKSKDSSMKSKTLAYTTRKTSGFKMKAAVIYYRPGSQNLDLINEHELGHALGFAHFEEEHHIMHPLYHKMGKNFYVP